jgi:hypothetical protein
MKGKDITSELIVVFFEAHRRNFIERFSRLSLQVLAACGRLWAFRYSRGYPAKGGLNGRFILQPLLVFSPTRY